MRNVLRFVCATLVGACAAAPVSAQVLAPRGPLGETGPFSGGVPTGQRSEQPLPLTLADAISCGLEHNLGVIARQEDVEQARSERWRALSAVLPNVSGRLSADREVINLAALGFTADLGPLSDWGLTLDRRHIVVDSTTATNLPRVFAAGDITEYPGKVRLIATGFGEAATAVNNAAVAIDPSAHLFPGHSSDN